MIVTAKSSDARPLNTGTSTREKVSHPVGMVQPTLKTPAPNVPAMSIGQVITKCGEDLFKDSQPSAAASKAEPATPQDTSISSTNNYQVLKLSVNGKLQNYLVSMKKPSSNTSERVIAYGPFDFVGGKMTSAAVNLSQTGSAATSVKYPDSRPAPTNQSVVSKESPAVPLPFSLAKPGQTQNTTVNQLPPKPTLIANKPVVVTSKHSILGTSASVPLANLVSIVPTSMSHGTTEASSHLPTTSKILSSYSQNRLTRPSDNLESSVRTLHSSISSLMSRPANTVEPNACNLMTTTSISSTCSFSVSNAPLQVPANRQISGLEMGGTLVKGPQSRITYIAKAPTSSTAKATTYTTASSTCSKPQNRFVVVKDTDGKIIGIQKVALTKETGAPSGVAGAVDANASAVQPIPCTTFVSSNSTTVPRITTLNIVNASYQRKPDVVSEHCLKIDSVYSLAEQPAPVTVISDKTGGSTDPSAPGHSLSECNDYTKDSTAESPILASEQPAFLEVIDVDPCKVVIRKISQHFPTNITKKTFNKLNSACNIRKRPWSKFVREHLSSYFRKEKFAKSELNPENVYRILQESPLTVVAMPRKAVQTDKVDYETEKVYQRPQTARKRGHGRKNLSRCEDVTDNVLKKPKLASENNEDPDPLSRPRPLLMSALRMTTPPLPGCSVAKSTATTHLTPVCSVARSTATPQMPVFSVAQSTATLQSPVCSVVLSTAVTSTPNYRSIINPDFVPPKIGTVSSATTMLPNKCVVKSQSKSVDFINALKSVHPTPAPALQKDKALPSGVHEATGLSEMFCGETKKFSLPVGPCVTAGFTGKAVFPGKDGSAPENYLILRTSESCYFVPVGKNAYVIPISKATGVIQSCKKPVMSTACFGDVASVSESRAMKVASQVTTMPILTAEAGEPRMTTKATHYHDISKTLSPQTDSTQSKTSFPPEMSRGDDNLSKSGTNNGLSGVRIKSEPVTTGYPGDPGDEPPRLSPASSPVPAVDRIKTEQDSETDDAWSSTEMPDEEAPSEEEASNIHFKSVADLYRSRQSQYQLTDDYQASEEDEEAAIRAERIRKLRDLLKAKEEKCDMARQRWSGDKTEKLIKDFDDI